MIDARRLSDHGDYLAMLRRMIRALSRRIGDSDPYDLALMLELRAELDAAIQTAVDSQRAAGFSWSDIAGPAGMTKQAAFQRWGRRPRRVQAAK